MSDDESLSTRLIYLHGFNSSPDSKKAQSLQRFISEEQGNMKSGKTVEVVAPALPYKADEAIGMLEELLSDAGHKNILFGSSLGGFYCIYLAQKYPCKVVLINPLVSLPDSFMDEFPGKYTNPYSEEEFEVTRTDVKYLQGLEVASIDHQENYLLLVESGDEVLDYQVATKKLTGARHIIIKGGTHRFENFDRLLPEIMQFIGLQVSSAQ